MLASNASIQVNATGGWLPSGSPSKPLMPIAYTTTTLAWALTAFPGGFANDAVRSEALANVRTGADYLLKSFDKASGRLVVQVGRGRPHAPSDQLDAVSHITCLPWEQRPPQHRQLTWPAPPAGRRPLALLDGRPARHRRQAVDLAGGRPHPQHQRPPGLGHGRQPRGRRCQRQRGCCPGQCCSRAEQG